MAASKDLPAKAYLMEVFSVIENKLVFKTRPCEHFCDATAQKKWNTRYAGSVAGTVDKDGRLVVRVGGVNYYAHRLMWVMCGDGEVPSSIDHVDGDPLNNAISNLRAATHTQNMANSKCRQRADPRLPRGVYASGNGTRFVAQITVKGKSKSLGTFDTALAAKSARDAAVQVAYGCFARY
jgi:hypothetical protein